MGVTLSPHKRMLVLPDGRRLAYAEFGEPNGIPCFFFHGLVGSRLQGKLAHSAALAHGVRIISVDRPGFGWSDPDPDATFLDSANDVAALADALEIQQFVVVGVSAGAAYAAACGVALPGRVPVVGIVSGVGLLTGSEFIRDLGKLRRIVLWVAKHIPPATSLIIRPLSVWLRGHPEHFVRWMKARMAQPDAQTLRRPEIHAIFVESIREALQQHGRGITHDLVRYTHPWDFRLEDIPSDVHLWHGVDDVTVPVGFAHQAAQVIPRCHPKFFPNEGHLLAITRMEDIMDDLQAAFRERRVTRQRQPAARYGAQSIAAL